MTRAFPFALRILPVFLIVFFLRGARAYPQEILGIVNGNYAGVNGSLMNPASMGNSGRFVSVNLLGGDFFICSNYLYVHRKDYGISKIFSVNTGDPAYRYIYPYDEFRFEDTVHYYDYKKNGSLRRMYANIRLLGPSVMLHAGRHAFSLVTGFRNNISMDKVTSNTANFMYRGMDFEPQHNIKYTEGPYQICLLSWMEEGLGYANTFMSTADHEMTAGAAVKYLLGTGAAWAALRNVTYHVPNSDSIVFEKLNCTFGFALPVNYAGGSGISMDPLIKGTGWSVDFGISWVRKAGLTSANASAGGDGEAGDDYRFRVGLSLLDLGKISFNKTVQVHEFRDVTNRIWPGLRNFHANSIQHFMRSASYHLLGDSLASLTGRTGFSVWLPAAVSLQGDYNFGNHLFANATFVQGIPVGTPRVRRATLLAVTPRYETRIWEVNFPLSLLDFRSPQIGLAFRIYSLTIGTEKLGTFLNVTDVQGLDFYFALGFNLSPGKKDWKSKGNRSGPCDSYENYDRYRIRDRYR